MYKTHNCGELRATHTDLKVTLAGWVHRRRDHGGVIFLDLRDRYGIIQVTVNPNASKETLEHVANVRMEWVLQVSGTVHKRPAGMENPKMATGEIEIIAESVEVLNSAKTLPFMVSGENDLPDENTRLKYRYLDLRRERMTRNLVLRHKVVKFMRDFLDKQGFIEIETPILFKATPEGARDYLVPSRLYPGQFYALPQSPQQLKQLLMVAGMDRYFQIARCFRDEDLRGDRQPEFTQLDLEMSFVQRDDVLALVEQLYTELIPTVTPHKKLLSSPWPRLSYRESVERFGTDKPDMRFGMELIDVSTIFAKSEFKVFQSALETGGMVKCIVAPGCAEYSRKEVDALTESAKTFGAKGLATLAVTGEGLKGTAAKFIKPEESEAVKSITGAKEGDLILFAADQRAVVNKVLGGLRLILRDKLNLANPNVMAFAWVVDFPMFEFNEGENRWDALHHPFTAPTGDLDGDPGQLRSRAYDLVMDGTELGGGSIRINTPEVQLKMLEILGMDLDAAQESFGFLLDALKYGAPPLGGIAFGLDRVVALMAGTDSIRDVIAFPKTASGADPMSGAPSPVGQRQLRELGLRLG